MAKRRQTGTLEPLYIRWIPETCPYALEMRLDLISRLRPELDKAEAQGVELGGVFVGALPRQDAPTLRLDDLIIVPGSPQPETKRPKEFTLESEQLKRLAVLAAEANSTGRDIVGFFRSHLRGEPITLTVADRAMVAPQFPGGIYSYLLIGPGGESPREGLFFLAMDGQLSATPASSPFIFEEKAFQSLPEVPSEAVGDLGDFDFERTPPRRPLPWPAILSLALVLFLICTWALGSRISQMFRPASNQVDLAAVRFGNNLKITWDNGAPVFDNALGATLVIQDGKVHREVKLDTNDLRLGQVSYERQTKKVYVVMTLDSPGNKVPVQTFDWTGE